MALSSAKEAVINPNDYITSACYEPSPYFPLYYFIQQTTASIDDTIELIRSVNVKGMVRDKIVARLQQSAEELTIGKLDGTGIAAVNRKQLYDKLRTKALEASDTAANHPMNPQQRLLEAITHTDATFDREYLFTLLEQTYLPMLAHLPNPTRSAFRKAVCHLDLVWYKAHAI